MVISIGFGHSETILVNSSLENIRVLVQDALTNRKFIEFKADNGEIIIVNPIQIKIIQETK